MLPICKTTMKCPKTRCLVLFQNNTWFRRKYLLRCLKLEGWTTWNANKYNIHTSHLIGVGFAKCCLLMPIFRLSSPSLILFYSSSVPATYISSLFSAYSVQRAQSRTVSHLHLGRINTYPGPPCFGANLRLSCHR